MTRPLKERTPTNEFEEVLEPRTWNPERRGVDLWPDIPWHIRLTERGHTQQEGKRTWDNSTRL